MVTDIRFGAGVTTAPLPVVKFLKKHGVKVVSADTVSRLSGVSDVINKLIGSVVNLFLSLYTFGFLAETNMKLFCFTFYILKIISVLL
jgi:hypothetical protein